MVAWLRRPRARTQDEAQAQMLQLAQDYRTVFATDAGQRVLADILGRNYVAQTTFQSGQPDLSAFNEGRRRAALELVEMINRKPDAQRALISTGETEVLFNG